jgi:hypothetical protein
MARQGWGRHSTVATGTDSGDQVSVNAWNADLDKDGMLGFNVETIASASSITPSSSTILLTGSTNVSTIAVTNTAEYDLLYVFSSGTVNLVNASSPSSSGDIKLLANADKTLSSTVPTILIRKGTFWYEYGGGITNALNDVGDVTITSASQYQTLTYNGSNWVNNAPDKLYYVCKNASGSSIAKGKFVYISGYDTVNSYIEISLAANTSASTMPAFGITMEAISAGSTGKVLQQGKMTGLNTDGIAEGTTLYIGTSGDWVTTKPTGTALIQNVGEVLKDNISDGHIHVGGSGRANDVPNIPDGKIWIGNASAVATAVTPSGDVTISNTGVTAIGSGVIVNDDINASAAIDATKIANGSVSSTEFQYLDGVTSAIQTQIDSKQATLTFGIADGNALDVDQAGGAASADYAKFTTAGIEGRSYTEVKTDLSLDNVENTAVSTWAGSTNLTTLGTIATGTWNGTAVSEAYGGTNQTTYTTGDILYASGANTLAKLTAGSDGEVLTLASGVPSWAAAASGAAPTILLEFKYQASNYTTPTYTTRTVNDATTPIQLWVKDIDTNNQGVYIRIKKNNAYEDVQIA